MQRHMQQQSVVFYDRMKPSLRPKFDTQPSPTQDAICVHAVFSRAGIGSHGGQEDILIPKPESPPGGTNESSPNDAVMQSTQCTVLAGKLSRADSRV